jgi:predicted nucleic acid-binding protein
MKQRIFSHFQEYLIQYISHQYQNLLYCNSSQYMLSTYNSQHNNNNNVVLAMTMPYSDRVIAKQHYLNIVHDPKENVLLAMTMPI